jgi:tetratricopeptide (TPR) repeat protein
LRLLDGLETTDAVALRARIHAYLGGIRNRQGRWEEAIAACRRAIEEAESVGEPSALARALSGLDWALVESGRREEATHSWRALEIFEELGDLEHEGVVLNNLGMFAYFDGRWDDAIALYQRAGECGRRSGRPADMAFTDCNVGEILSDQGRLEEAEEHLRQARRVWSSTQESQSVAFADMLLGRLALRRGDSQVGLPMLERSTRALRVFSMQSYAEFGRALIAEAEALAGDPGRALELARAELNGADRQRPLLLRVVGIALARLGDAEAACRELGEALACARSRGADYEIAATIDALAVLGRADADLLAERDEILGRLKIVRLARPMLAQPVPTLVPTDRPSPG